MPIGTLMRKAQCQDAYVVSQPPTSGPRAAMPPIVPPQTAKAIARSLPTNTALMTDSELGRIIAPPMPWRARAAMRVLAESDAATRTLAATNTTTPSMNSSLRPERSAMRPERMSSDAKVSEYAALTHSASLVVSPRSCTIVGIATFTTVASRMIIDTPSARKASAAQRFRPVRTVPALKSVGALMVLLRRTVRRLLPTWCRDEVCRIAGDGRITACPCPSTRPSCSPRWPGSPTAPSGRWRASRRMRSWATGASACTCRRWSRRGPSSSAAPSRWTS